MNPNSKKFYIDGAWIDPGNVRTFAVVNAATEEVTGEISLGAPEHVDAAVAAARRAFATYSRASVEDRLALLRRIIDGYNARRDELAEAMTHEMSTPITFSKAGQVSMALFHFEEMARVLEDYRFEYSMGTTLIRREPIGVCGLITAWNWPLSLVTAKVAPAIAAGCTVVVKPSEMSPYSALLLTEVLHDAGVPKGVFNLVFGEGPVVGEAIARHPGVDMVSITGSTRAGVRVAEVAAPTVKRVTQELGGKSPNVILRSADLPAAVTAGVFGCYINNGQACQAATRMLVHRSQREEAIAHAKAAAEGIRIGDPYDPSTQLGPLVNKAQFDKVQGLIEAGIKEGATLVTGGVGRPDGFNRGYYVKPTVFADVAPDMRIAREEIFGPVLSMQFYDTDEAAIALANDTEYGLAAFVSGELEEARRIANEIRAGRVYINGAAVDRTVPFGGYKRSGNGREYGVFGFEEYLEVKAVLGHHAA
jgi:aldehyde dehydrogenase (NAD+)